MKERVENEKATFEAWERLFNEATEAAVWHESLAAGLAAEVAELESRRRAELRLDEVETTAKARAETATAARRTYMHEQIRAWAPHGRLAFVGGHGGCALDRLLRFRQEGEDLKNPPPWPVVVPEGDVARCSNIDNLLWSSPFHPRYFSVGLEGVEQEKVNSFIRDHLAEPRVRLNNVVLHLPKRYRPVELPAGTVSQAGGGCVTHLDGRQARLAGYLVVLSGMGRYGVLTMEWETTAHPEERDRALEYMSARFWGVATDPPPEESHFSIQWLWADDHWKWVGQPLVPLAGEERRFFLEKGVEAEVLDRPAGVREEVK